MAVRKFETHFPRNVQNIIEDGGATRARYGKNCEKFDAFREAFRDSAHLSETPLIHPARWRSLVTHVPFPGDGTIVSRDTSRNTDGRMQIREAERARALHMYARESARSHSRPRRPLL